MAEHPPMRYYQRTQMERHPGNQLTNWYRASRICSQWIQVYFQQPIRDRLVRVAATDEDGDAVHFDCMADTNDKITGTTPSNTRYEILQCRADLIDETLARYP